MQPILSHYTQGSLHYWYFVDKKEVDLKDINLNENLKHQQRTSSHPSPFCELTIFNTKQKATDIRVPTNKTWFEYIYLYNFSIIHLVK